MSSDQTARTVSPDCNDPVCAELASQAKPSQSSNWGGDLREAQFDVPLSVSHSRVWSRSWAQ